jgi:hypothetical protein
MADSTLKIQVFHVADYQPGYGNTAKFPEEYRQVAEVTNVPEGTGHDTALERAFFLTNHIDYAWWENEGVDLVGSQCRSTSVGDVVTVEGKPYRCEPVGWVALGQLG